MLIRRGTKEDSEECMKLFELDKIALTFNALIIRGCPTGFAMHVGWLDTC